MLQHLVVLDYRVVGYSGLLVRRILWFHRTMMS